MLNPHQPCFFLTVFAVQPGNVIYGLFLSAGIVAEPDDGLFSGQLNDKAHRNSIVPDNSSDRDEKSGGSICIQ